MILILNAVCSACASDSTFIVSNELLLPLVLFFIVIIISIIVLFLKLLNLTVLPNTW